MNLHMSMAAKNISKIEEYKPYFVKAFGNGIRHLTSLIRNFTIWG